MNYTWKVIQMDRKASDGFVITCHYTVSAVDGEFTASTYGTVGYTQESDNYTPYEQLTQEQVVGWVQESLGKDTVEEALDAQIELQKNPVTLSGTPWEAIC
jgi:hypothetical protein